MRARSTRTDMVSNSLSGEGGVVGSHELCDSFFTFRALRWLDGRSVSCSGEESGECCILAGSLPRYMGDVCVTNRQRRCIDLPEESGRCRLSPERQVLGQRPSVHSALFPLQLRLRLAVIVYWAVHVWCPSCPDRGDWMRLTIGGSWPSQSVRMKERAMSWSFANPRVC